MAFEYNAKCSRAPSLKNYINTKYEGKYFIELYNLQDKNRIEKFKKIDKIKKFNFTTSSRFLSTQDASQAKGIFKAAFATLDLTQNDTDLEQVIKIEMSPVRKKKGSEYPYYDATIIKNSIMESSSIENDQIPFKLDIVGYNELNEEIRVNYFKDIIVETISLKSDQVSSENFYNPLIMLVNNASFSNIYSLFIKLSYSLGMLILLCILYYFTTYGLNFVINCILIIFLIVMCTIRVLLSLVLFNILIKIIVKSK